MFQDQLEKGLFTFYWEETHPERNHHPTHRSQLVEPHQLSAERGGAGMEEKKVSGNHHRTEKQGQGIKRHQSDLYFQIEKQGKSVLVPHTITLAPGLASPRPKADYDQHRPKHFKEPAKIKTLEPDKRGEEADHNPLEKLLFSDETIECHKKTLEIDESQALAKSSCLSTVRPAKIRKATLREVQNCEKLQSNEKFPAINSQKESPPQSGRLPLLLACKRSQKKLKKLKQNYLLQKIWLEKGSEVSSVVNIGMSSIDDYKLRWRKRKAEFLALLSQSAAERGSD